MNNLRFPKFHKSLNIIMRVEFTTYHYWLIIILTVNFIHSYTAAVVLAYYFNTFNGTDHMNYFRKKIHTYIMH